MAFVMITGCQTHQESSKPGTIKEINIDKMVEKFDDEDTFVVKTFMNYWITGYLHIT